MSYILQKLLKKDFQVGTPIYLFIKYIHVLLYYYVYYKTYKNIDILKVYNKSIGNLRSSYFLF